MYLLGLYRDVEKLLAEPGIEIDHFTVYRWAQHCTPLLAGSLGARLTYRRAVSNGLSNNSSALGASSAFTR